MIGGASSSALQTGFVCLVGGLSLGLLIICGSQVPKFQMMDQAHSEALSRQMQEVDLDKPFAVRISLSSSSDKPMERAEVAKVTPIEVANMTWPTNPFRHPDGDHQTMPQSLDPADSENHHQTVDQGIFKASRTDDSRLSGNGTQEQKKPAGTVLVADRENSRSEISEFDIEQADEDLTDGDELPDEDILQDGQDESPELKAQAIQRRLERLKQEEKGVEQVQNMIADAVARNKAGEQGDANTNDAEFFEELMSVQKDLAKMMKPRDAINTNSANLAQSGASATVQKVNSASSIASKSKSSSSIAQLSQSQAKRLVDDGKASFKIGKNLSRTEQAFIYQMSDVIALEHGLDIGGESLDIISLTEEEADAADSQEFDSLKAYGAAAGDMVVFLQVKQGTPAETRAMKADRRRLALGLPILTMELIKNQTVDNLVIVTFATWHSYDFVLNWAAHMRSINVSNFLVGALDLQTSTGLAALGVPGFRMFSAVPGMHGLSNRDFLPQEERRYKFERQKIALAQLFTDFGFDVLFTDVDVAWLRNPLPVVSRMATVDILTASDSTTAHVLQRDEELVPLESSFGELSLSVMYLRHSKQVQQFLQAWDQFLAAHSSQNAQTAFNALISKQFQPHRSSMSDSRLAFSISDGTTMGVLNPALFANGQTYLIQTAQEAQQVQHYCVHANYVSGGRAAKRHRLREAGLWKHSPRYYDQPHGFIEMEVHPVKAPHKLMSEVQMIQLHTEKLNEQLVQLRAGLAIAVALDRAIILPKLTCFCERLWSVKSRCRAPGFGGMPRPFTCPLDTVLDVQSFINDDPHHGPTIDFREHNFLDQQNLPAGMKDSRVRVNAASRKALLLSKLLDRQVEEAVSVLPGLSDQQLQEALAEHVAVKILTFTSVTEVFGGFRDSSLAAAVSSRLALIRGSWQYGPSSQQVYSYGVDSSIEHLVFKAN